MTLLIISFILWGLVIFMMADEHCRKNEKSALSFLASVSVILTVIGIINFEGTQLSNVSLKDWGLLLFFPIILIYLAFKSHLVKMQSRVLGQEITLAELDLAQIEDSKLIGKFKLIRTLMWVYAVALLAMIIWSDFGKSI